MKLLLCICLNIFIAIIPISVMASERFLASDLDKNSAVKNLDEPKKLFNEVYDRENNHKALALSASGAWNFCVNATSEYHAKNVALIGCEIRNKKTETDSPCQIVNLNNAWINTSAISEQK